MQDLQSLVKIVDDLPTILSAKQELHLLATLREIGDESLLIQMEYLCHILERIGESHSGGGIFEVSTSNQHEFECGADWIERLSNNSIEKRSQEFLMSIAETLRAKFPSD